MSKNKLIKRFDLKVLQVCGFNLIRLITEPQSRRIMLAPWSILYRLVFVSLATTLLLLVDAGYGHFCSTFVKFFIAVLVRSLYCVLFILVQYRFPYILDYLKTTNKYRQSSKIFSLKFQTEVLLQRERTFEEGPLFET